MRLSESTKGLISLALAHAVLECFSGVWPIYKHLAKVDLLVAGLISSLTMLIAALLQPFFGHWADQGKARAMVILGTGMTMLMSLLGPIGLLSSDLDPPVIFALLTIFTMASRLGHSMFHPAGATLSGKVLGNRPSAGLGYFVALGWAGYGFSQLTFSTAFLATNGHTELLLLIGLPALALIALWSPNKETENLNRDPVRTKLKSMWAMRRNLGLLFATATLIGAGNSGLFFMFPELLESKGYSGWLIHGGGFAFLIMGIAMGVSIGGHLADRVRVPGLLVAASLLNFVTYEGFVLMGTMPTPVFVASCVLAGVCMGVCHPLPVVMAQLLNPRNSSLVSGVMMGWAWALGSLSPLTVAVLVQVTTVPEALALLGFLNLGAAFCAWPLLRETPDVSRTSEECRDKPATLNCDISPNE